MASLPRVSCSSCASELTHHRRFQLSATNIDAFVAALVRGLRAMGLPAELAGLWSAREVDGPGDEEPISLADFRQLTAAEQKASVTRLSRADLAELSYPNEADWDRFTGKALGLVLAAKGLTQSGSKAAQKERLHRAGQAGGLDAVTTARRVLLETSYPKPVGSSKVREYFAAGHANERAVLSSIEKVFSDVPLCDASAELRPDYVTYIYTGEAATQCGLWCRRDFSAAVASPDAIYPASVICFHRACLPEGQVARPEYAWADAHCQQCDMCRKDEGPLLVEVKTALADATRDEQRDLLSRPEVRAALNGHPAQRAQRTPVFDITVDAASAANPNSAVMSLLRALIPARKRRMQVLHQCMVMGTRRVLYLSTIPNAVLFGVAIHFDQRLLDAELRFIKAAYAAVQQQDAVPLSGAVRAVTDAARALGVTYIHAPCYTNKDPSFDWGYAVDCMTVRLRISLRARFIEWVLREGRPLPEARGAKLMAVLRYNRIKAGIDNKTSQTLRRNDAEHTRKSPGTVYSCPPFDSLTHVTGGTLVFAMIDLALLNVHRLCALFAALKSRRVTRADDVDTLFRPDGAYSATPGRLERDLKAVAFKDALLSWVTNEHWKRDRRSKRGTLTNFALTFDAFDDDTGNVETPAVNAPVESSGVTVAKREAARLLAVAVRKRAGDLRKQVTVCARPRCALWTDAVPIRHQEQLDFFNSPDGVALRLSRSVNGDVLPLVHAPARITTAPEPRVALEEVRNAQLFAPACPTLPHCRGLCRRRVPRSTDGCVQRVSTARRMVAAMSTCRSPWCVASAKLRCMQTAQFHNPRDGDSQLTRHRLHVTNIECSIAGPASTRRSCSANTSSRTGGR